MILATQTLYSVVKPIVFHNVTIYGSKDFSDTESYIVYYEPNGLGGRISVGALGTSCSSLSTIFDAVEDGGFIRITVVEQTGFTDHVFAAIENSTSCGSASGTYTSYDFYPTTDTNFSLSVPLI